METINFEIIKPAYSIGDKVYTASKEGAKPNTVFQYQARIIQNKERFEAVVTHYVLQFYFPIRRGHMHEPLEILAKENDFYNNLKEAKAASRFYPMEFDPITWSFAIGDRDDKDPNSRSNIENCDLVSCCPAISDARDILLYAKRQRGLIEHDRKTLAKLLENHEYRKSGHLGQILQSLRM